MAVSNHPNSERFLRKVTASCEIEKKWQNRPNEAAMSP